MSRLEQVGFALFIATCLAFIAGALCMVEIIATNELRLNQ
jgi:hypothetical protein